VKTAAICLSTAFLVVTAAVRAGGTDPRPAAAPDANPLPSMQRERLHEVSATVTAVDAKTRMIDLKADDGSTGAYEAGPDVKNFGQIHVGDKVVVSYYQGLAAQVLPPGTAVSDSVKQMDVATAAEPGTKPGAGIGTALNATVVIEKVDTKANTVTFKRPDGVSRTLPVQSDEGKAFIKKLKAGDKVDVVYAEAVAVEVKPAPKK
jgi:Cu/Ag efflux protein CusF